MIYRSFTFFSNSVGGLAMSAQLLFHFVDEYLNIYRAHCHKLVYNLYIYPQEMTAVLL